jgi:hypothetical protein
LLIELFLIEDYDDLERQLLRLFPGNRRLKERIDSFSGAACDLFGGGWINIGHIVREKTNSFSLPFAVASLPELPEEVHYIAVSVSKILPSLFAVSFNVDLTQEATKKLQTLLNKTYLSHITFGGVLPLRKNLNTWSELSSEQVMRAEVLHSLAALRLRVEKQLSSRFKGLFLRLPKARTPRLPAMEMLSIQGFASPDTVEIVEKLRCNTPWVSCFGLTHWRVDDLFVSARMLFQWSGYEGDSEITPYKLVAFEGSDEDSKSQERKALAFDDIARSITPLIAVLGFIESTRRNVGTLRVAVYKTLTNKLSFKRLTSEIRLNDEMQLKQMILLRLQFELKASAWTVEYEARNLRAFLTLNKNPERTLGAVLLSTIDNRLRGVCGHSEVVSNALSAYLQRRNLEVTYKLQRRLQRWTVLVSLVTLYGVAKDWPMFEHIAHWLRLHLH